MFSIIIPTFNGAERIAQTLPCWFSQSVPKDKYEVFVVDNRSTDNTRTVVEQLIAGEENFQYLYEEQPGATAARHAGVRASKGDILVFADDDVLVEPECLEEIQKAYEGNSECVAVTGKIELLWDKEEPEWIAPYRYLLGELDYGKNIRYSKDFYLNGGLMSVRRDIFERLHGFNPDLVGAHLIGDGDTGFVKKLFKEGLLIGYSPRAVARHMQKVEKHGSVEGIALHFFNNGIALSYSIYREEGFRFSGQVIRHLLRETAICFRQRLKQWVLRKKDYQSYFALKWHEGCIQFFRLLRDPQLRREIRIMNVYGSD